MKFFKSRKVLKKDNYFGLKHKLNTNKRANIYVGDETYKSNFFMDFNTPSFNAKFHKDIVIRLKYTAKSLILLYLIFYLFDVYFFIKQSISLSTLLCIIGCIWSIYLWEKNHNGFMIRICMAIPLFILQNTVAIYHNSSFAMVMLINLPIDVWTLAWWKYHISSMLAQNLFVLISMHNNNMKMEESAMKPTKPSDFLMILVLCIFEIILFWIIEKFLKEFWVIRETSEKSFRTVLSLIEDNHNEIFIIDKNKSILYANKAFEDSMVKLINDRHPNHLNDFVHENSFESLENKIGVWLKEQKRFTTNIFLIKKSQNKSTTQTIDSSCLSTSGKL